MTSSAQKMLEKMRLSKSGWKRADLDRLYKGFGFIMTHGASHDIVKHIEYPQLRTTLPRHNDIAKGYVQEAIRLIDSLLELQEKTRE